ncbi:Alpha/Beta hydrolase protein [Dactylonectria macrodidyma]|uniref:Carboxylic ester hydrolase n=1 Tax=Dactylonectria macrodidyma TaxID=307937 RepID=A0A9P9J850_9HYPO|nr:Alpha/Beta hydrolase protein [Dactylonectria macrodidyma]
MAKPIEYVTLDATLYGVADDRFTTPVWHFRNLPYATISERFETPKPVKNFQTKSIDATAFGPQCPQVKLDPRHFMRVPDDVEAPEMAEDEFACLNLNITCPPLWGTHQVNIPQYPVVIWIHGGSQTVTFASSASPICDPTRLVSESVQHEKAIIFISFNYRLNVFAFGDGLSEVNLALQDQRALISWVQRNIHRFGGDANNITLAGESAGAVYVHAHMASGTTVNKAILASGSLYLSPPLPRSFGSSLLQRLTSSLQDMMPGESLRTAPAEAIIATLEATGVKSMWIQEEASLANWETKETNVGFLMIGDTEYESAIWRTGIDQASAGELIQQLQQHGDLGRDVQPLYHIHPQRPVATRLGVLDLLNDARFALPAYNLSQKWRLASRPVYQYIVDQQNPWQPSSGAHHAVDLFFLFGGIDVSSNRAAERIGYGMRKAWVDFAHGDAPWDSRSVQAFGPLGKIEQLDMEGYGSRRRVEAFERLNEAGTAKVLAISGTLAAGRISLEG